MRLHDLTLSKKLVLFGLAVTVVALGIITTTFLKVGANELRSEIEDNEIAIANITAQNLVPFLELSEPEMVEEVLKTLRTRKQIEFAVAYTHPGNEVFASYVRSDVDDQSIPESHT